MVNLQLEIFILISIGWILGKSKKLSQSTAGQLNWLVMNLILPCSIAKAFQMELTQEIRNSTMMIFSVSIVMQAGFYFLSRFVWNKVQDQKKRINLSYATLCNNAGTLGMVIAQAAFGDTGVLYASVYMIPVRVLMWACGIASYSKYGENTQSGKKKPLWKAVFAHPCLIGVYCGCILMLLATLKISLPEFLQMSLNALSACNTPMIMLVIGLILSQVNLKDLLKPLLYEYSLARLILFPLAALAVLKLCGLSGSVLQVCALETAMPAPVTMVMLAQSYKCDQVFASQVVFVSTMLSLITLPLWTYILTLPVFG